MPKATVKLPNGTLVTIEGTPEEVAHLLDFYGGKASAPPPKPRVKGQEPKIRKKATTARQETEGESRVDLTDIVNLVKSCDEAEAIETQILDRTSQVNRILLPLYIVYENKGNAFGLTSGEISQITIDLGIPISQPNASTALSGTASRYVIGDKVRKKGQPVRYKLSRRGIQYLKSVLEAHGHEDTK